MANLIGADPKEIIFTSGATESNNLAVKGVAGFHKDKKRHIITTQTEHKCVLDSCRYLQQRGFDVTYLPVQANGLVDMQQLEDAIRPDTALVSVMMVNNEIGMAMVIMGCFLMMAVYVAVYYAPPCSFDQRCPWVAHCVTNINPTHHTHTINPTMCTGVLQPIEEIGALCRKYKVYLHTDAAQAVGKVPVNVQDLNVDLMSISGHKLYGPKGIGALYVRRRPRVRLEAQMSGGGQERGLRSGTLYVVVVVLC